MPAPPTPPSAATPPEANVPADTQGANHQTRAHRLGTEYVQTMRSLAEATADDDDQLLDIHINNLENNSRALDRLDKNGYSHALLGIHDALLDTFNDLIVKPSTQTSR